MSCCTDYIELCDISSCDEWITTTVAEPEVIEVLDPIAFDVTAKFNGIQLTPQLRFQGGFLQVKNTFVPNYTYVLKVVSHEEDPVTTCYRFSIIQNVNL